MWSTAARWEHTLTTALLGTHETQSLVFLSRNQTTLVYTVHSCPTESYCQCMKVLPLWYSPPNLGCICPTLENVCSRQLLASHLHSVGSSNFGSLPLGIPAACFRYFNHDISTKAPSSLSWVFQLMGTACKTPLSLSDKYLMMYISWVLLLRKLPTQICAACLGNSSPVLDQLPSSLIWVFQI